MFEVGLQKAPHSGVLEGSSFVRHAETSSGKNINETKQSDAQVLQGDWCHLPFSSRFMVSSGVGGGRRESMAEKRREGERKKNPLV